GGQPCPYDRVLATMLGTAAADLIVRDRFGVMVGLRNGQTVPVPLSEVAGKRRQVLLDSCLVRSARSLGIAFGDETD
ncbi:MAG: 6-phosphofructokinase, partial [Eubacteriales bacterium]|nr:6-phosphofructokinase [Eubacteriales bacterium]